MGLWSPACWLANGNFWAGQEHLLDILPPKRKAWVVWVNGEPRSVWQYEDVAREVAATAERYDGKATVQEITEP